MQLLGRAILVAMIVALARPVVGDELTADQVIDRMLAANKSWLRAEVESVSYVLKTYRDPEQTITVQYRAPDNLRVEIEPGGAGGLVRGGSGFAWRWSVSPREWDADRTYDGAMQGLVVRGAAWILANHRDRCKVSGFRREPVDGRDAYHLLVSGYWPTVDAFVLPGPASGEKDSRYLWIDAETFRPLREAYDCAGTGETRYCVLRYQDFRPFPGDGEAPMRLEEYYWFLGPERPLNADPAREASTICTYHVVDGKYWFHKVTTVGGKPDQEVTEISTAPVPATVFDGTDFPKLARAAELHKQARTYEKEERWRELMGVCDEILAGGLGVAGVRHNAIRLHFWHGDYRKVTEFAESFKGGSKDDDIYVAWAYDALGEREKALAVYRDIKAHTSRGWETPEADQGLKQPWVPIAKRLQPKDGERLLEPAGDWRAESNDKGERPEAAIDGERRSSWVSWYEQVRGTWFQVDLGKPTVLTRVAFDFVGDLAWSFDDYHEYPRAYALSISSDGERWQTVAQEPGLRDNLVSSAFAPREVRYVRMRLTTSVEFNSRWAIHEIFFYAPK